MGCISMAQWSLYGVYQYGTVEFVWGVSVWHSGVCMGCISMAQWSLYGVYQSGTAETVGIKMNVHTQLASSSLHLCAPFRKTSQFTCNTSQVVRYEMPPNQLQPQNYLTAHASSSRLIK